MGHKTIRHNKATSAELFQSAHRNLARGDAKQALKDAKLCFRQDPSDEHRRFLEHVYIARAQALRELKNDEACREVLAGLLELGVTEPAVLSALPELLTAAGIPERLPAQAPRLSGDEQRRLAERQADATVSDPSRARDGWKWMQPQAEAVRGALTAVNEGDAARAEQVLQAIPRESPFAEWKVFVRGLSAYYSQDGERMSANWSRLNPQRGPARIAKVLSALGGTTRVDPRDEQLAAAIARVQRGVTNQGVLDKLEAAARAVEEQDWRQVGRSLAALRPGLREINPDLYPRVVRCVLSQLVTLGEPEDLDELTPFIDPLPIDPRWNRTRALLYDELEGGPEAADCWRRYLDDLKQVTVLDDGQRKLAQAMVCRRLANYAAEDAVTLHRCQCGLSHTEDIEAATAFVRQYLEEAIGLMPDFSAAYEDLANLYLCLKQEDAASEVYRRLVQQVPDHVAGLTWLATTCLKTGQPLEAMPYCQAILRLKPLDEQSGRLLATCHHVAARLFVTQGDIPQGREHLAAARQVLGARWSYADQATVIALEIKTEQAEQVQSQLDELAARQESPLPVWLALCVELTRIQASPARIKKYGEVWQAGLKAKVDPAVATAICRYLVQLPDARPDFVLPGTWAQSVEKYLQRRGRTRWTEDQAISITQFVMAFGSPKLSQALVNGFIKKFPQVALFHLFMAQLQIQKPERPSYAVATAVVNSLDMALQLAAKGTRPTDAHVRREATAILRECKLNTESMAQSVLSGIVEQFHALPKGARAAVLERFAKEMGLTPSQLTQMLDLLLEDVG